MISHMNAVYEDEVFMAYVPCNSATTAQWREALGKFRRRIKLRLLFPWNTYANSPSPFVDRKLYPDYLQEGNPTTYFIPQEFFAASTSSSTPLFPSHWQMIDLGLGTVSKMRKLCLIVKDLTEEDIHAILSAIDLTELEALTVHHYGKNLKASPLVFLLSKLPSLVELTFRGIHLSMTNADDALWETVKWGSLQTLKLHDHHNDLSDQARPEKLTHLKQMMVRSKSTALTKEILGMPDLEILSLSMFDPDSLRLDGRMEMRSLRELSLLAHPVPDETQWSFGWQLPRPLKPKDLMSIRLLFPSLQKIVVSHPPNFPDYDFLAHMAKFEHATYFGLSLGIFECPKWGLNNSEFKISLVRTFKCLQEHKIGDPVKVLSVKSARDKTRLYHVWRQDDFIVTQEVMIYGRVNSNYWDKMEELVDSNETKDLRCEIPILDETFVFHWESS